MDGWMDRVTVDGAPETAQETPNSISGTAEAVPLQTNCIVMTTECCHGCRQMPCIVTSWYTGLRTPSPAPACSKSV